MRDRLDLRDDDVVVQHRVIGDVDVRGAEMPERFRCARGAGAEGYHGGLAQAPGQGQQLVHSLEHGAAGDLGDDEDVWHDDRLPR